MARGYAAALVDVSLEQRAAEQVKRELADFVRLFQESADLRNFLASPAVARPSKHAILDTLVKRLGASQTLRNFLYLIADHGRSHALPEIRQTFDAMLHARLGIAEAEVISAQELDAAQKSRLNQALERLTGQKVEACYALDANLIGGAVVRIASTIYDGSVRGQLERLQVTLAAE